MPAPMITRSNSSFGASAAAEAPGESTAGAVSAAASKEQIWRRVVMLKCQDCHPDETGWEAPCRQPRQEKHRWTNRPHPVRIPRQRLSFDSVQGHQTSKFITMPHVSHFQRLTPARFWFVNPMIELCGCFFNLLQRCCRNFRPPARCEVFGKRNCQETGCDQERPFPGRWFGTGLSPFPFELGQEIGVVAGLGMKTLPEAEAETSGGSFLRLRLCHPENAPVSSGEPMKALPPLRATEKLCR